MLVTIVRKFKAKLIVITNFVKRKMKEINEISRRIVVLSAIHPSNKEFLKQCKISNHSLITDLKKGIENPGAHILHKLLKALAVVERGC